MQQCPAVKTVSIAINEPEHDAGPARLSSLEGEKKKLLPMLAQGSPCSAQSLALSRVGALQSAWFGPRFECASTCYLRSLAGAAAATCSGSCAPYLGGKKTKQFTPSHCVTGGGAAVANSAEMTRTAQNNIATPLELWLS